MKVIVSIKRMLSSIFINIMSTFYHPILSLRVNGDNINQIWLNTSQLLNNSSANAFMIITMNDIIRQECVTMGVYNPGVYRRKLMKVALILWQG